MTDLSNKDEERLLAKIRKLFELANNESSQGNEASNALRMANALLAKHSIDKMKLAVKDEVFASFLDYNLKQAWVKSVISAIGKFYSCRVVFDYNWDVPKTLVIGTSSRRITAVLVIDHLIAQIKKESRGQKVAFRNGAALGLHDKCMEILAERNADTGHDEVIPGTGLSIIDVEKTLKMKADEFTNKNFPNLRRGKGMRSASAEGRAYGQGLNPNARVSGEGQKCLN
jgi:hypothetical protein